MAGNRTVRIGVDARLACVPRPRGIGKTLRSLMRHAAALRPEWEFVLYHQEPVTANPFADRPNVRLRHADIRGHRFRLWDRFLLPLVARRDGVRLLHCPDGDAPTFWPPPVVLTVHDLIPLKVPEERPSSSPAQWEARMRASLRVAKHVIAISEATKTDLVDVMGVAPESISVVPWAADEYAGVKTSNDAEPESVARLTSGVPYILSFGGPSPRKNTPGIIEAFGRVPSDVRAGVRLLVVGVEPADVRDRFAQVAAAHGVRDAVTIAGYVSDDEVRALLRGALFLAFASFYEGFGLPILDAFAQGTAVLTSPVSSMPEVAGDAAEYCDPRDPASIAAKMTMLLGDPRRRRELQDAGRRRAGAYSWQRTAERVCAVYERCMA